jgi:ribosomal protein L11 methyltransferase
VAETHWVEVVVPVGAADVDELAARVADEVAAAAAGVEQRGDEIVFWVAREEAGQAMVEVKEAATRWRAAGIAVDPAQVRVVDALPEVEWRDAWKKFFKVSRLTRQIVVVPSWEHFAPDIGDVAIALDPGMAFGTGTHASTRLVLEELQRLADAGARVRSVLDVGCGSGILAIAAAKLWPAARIVAVDNDPLAIDATVENAAKNGVAVACGRELPSEAYDVVLANIQAHVLRELCGALVARVAGGTLVLSGLLTPQAEPVAEGYVAAGMAVVAVRASREDAQWSAVVLRGSGDRA